MHLVVESELAGLRPFAYCLEMYMVPQNTVYILFTTGMLPPLTQSCCLKYRVLIIFLSLLRSSIIPPLPLRLFQLPSAKPRGWTHIIARLLLLIPLTQPLELGGACLQTRLLDWRYNQSPTPSFPWTLALLNVGLPVLMYLSIIFTAPKASWDELCEWYGIALWHEGLQVVKWDWPAIVPSCVCSANCQSCRSSRAAVIVIAYMQTQLACWPPNAAWQFPVGPKV